MTKKRPITINGPVERSVFDKNGAFISRRTTIIPKTTKLIILRKKGDSIYTPTFKYIIFSCRIYKLLSHCEYSIIENVKYQIALLRAFLTIS